MSNALESSEQALKDFNERNMQVSSPALQLELEKLARNVEIQKGIFLTLKQQLELAKIEEVQKTRVLQVLDKPHVPLGASNKNIKLSILFAGILGTALGTIFAFIRSYFNSKDIEERKRIRRTKHFLKKKFKDLFKDRRIAGIVSGFMLIGLPLFLGTQSSNPVYFGMYSPMLMLVNAVYVVMLFASVSLFIYLSIKKV